LIGLTLTVSVPNIAAEFMHTSYPAHFVIAVVHLVRVL